MVVVVAGLAGEGCGVADFLGAIVAGRLVERDCWNAAGERMVVLSRVWVGS